MSIFKAYDIRGKYPDELNEEVAYKIGKAYVSVIKPKRVVVGRDCRISSPKIFEALCKSLTEQGVDIVDIGLATTPLMYFATAKLKADGGIQVTASHNPKDYNGFKLVREKAIPISGETGIYEIEKLVKENSFASTTKKGNISKIDVVEEYVENELSFIDKTKIKPCKVVIDTANAMGGLVLPRLFEKIGCEVVHMYPELDGSFPNHQPDPLQEELLDDLRKKIVEEKADLGIAADGDFDRIKFVDDKGGIIQGDLMTALLSKIILSQKPNAKIMYDLRSSKIVKETIEEAGGEAVMYRVGHSFIKAKMAQDNIHFAGELSGHYYFNENNNIESPLITTLHLLAHISENNIKLSEAIKPFRKYHQSGEINFEVANKEEAMKKIEETFKDAKQVHKIDGLSIEYEDFWFNFRPSNTEPLLRLNAEANTKEKLEEIKHKISSLLKQ